MVADIDRVSYYGDSARQEYLSTKSAKCQFLLTNLILNRLWFFRVLLFSQENWAESTGIVYVPLVPTHSELFPVLTSRARVLHLLQWAHWTQHYRPRFIMTLGFPLGVLQSGGLGKCTMTLYYQTYSVVSLPWKSHVLPIHPSSQPYSRTTIDLFTVSRVLPLPEYIVGIIWLSSIFRLASFT